MSYSDIPGMYICTQKKQTEKQPKFNIPEFPSQVVENVFKALKMNRKAKYSWLADNLGVGERTIQRAKDDLKKMGYINSEHSKIKGEWQLLKQKIFAAFSRQGFPKEDKNTRGVNALVFLYVRERPFPII